MLQVDIPKIFFPLEIIFRGTFKNLFVLFMLLVFLLLYTTPVSITWLALPVLMVIQFLFILSFGILCAAIVPFIPDLKIVISSLLRLAMFGSGIFYDIDKVILPQHRSILYLNPMAGLIQSYRDILMYAHWPDWEYLGYATVGGCISLAIAILLIFKMDRRYPGICQK